MIRNAKMQDAPQILELVNLFANKGLMLAKTPYLIYKNIQSFIVYEENGEIIGCARLAIFWKDLAEVASLATHPDHQKKGIGKLMVEELKKQAKYLGINTLFSLSYQQAFFEKCGFKHIPRESLPYKVFSDCLNCPKVEACDENAFIYQVE